MPWHLPDSDSVNTCTITFTIPDDPQFSAIIMGAIAQMAVERNWEAGTGDLTPSEAVAASLLIQESADYQGC